MGIDSDTLSVIQTNNLKVLNRFIQSNFSDNADVIIQDSNLIYGNLNRFSIRNLFTNSINEIIIPELKDSIIRLKKFDKNYFIIQSPTELYLVDIENGKYLKFLDLKNTNLNSHEIKFNQKGESDNNNIFFQKNVFYVCIASDIFEIDNFSNFLISIKINFKNFSIENQNEFDLATIKNSIGYSQLHNAEIFSYNDSIILWNSSSSHQLLINQKSISALKINYKNTDSEYLYLDPLFMDVLSYGSYYQQVEKIDEKKKVKLFSTILIENYLKIRIKEI